MAKRRSTSPRRSSSINGSRISLRTLCLVIIISAGIWAINASDGCKASSDNKVKPVCEGAYGNLMAVKTNPSLPSQEKSYTGMDLSFNPRLHVPNWVSWELTADEINGSVARKDKFVSDPDIEGCSETWDYSYSGYDRGHMAPAGDMKWSAKAMEETFYLSNICPQVHSLNSGAWKKLEEKCRKWAGSHEKIYIVCGPIVEPGPADEYIGDSRVWVPRRFFKVVIAPYSTPALGIGFIMPNGKVTGGMQQCVVSIDEIEELTGHDFFASLPDELENELESQANFAKWELSSSRR